MFKNLLLLLVFVFCSDAFADATIKFDKLPFDLALKIVKGNGQRKLAYFTDPQCAYCKKLENELKDVDNVTLYMFLYPVSAESKDIVRNIWCVNDPYRTWDKWTQDGMPPPFRNCTTKTENVLTLGKMLHVGGTPTLIFSNGSVIPGYMHSSDLELMMFAASH